MKKALIPTLALIGIAMMSGCTDAGVTKPANGYHADRTSDPRAQSQDKSPATPERSEATGQRIPAENQNPPRPSNDPMPSTPPTTPP